jgi:hypothetical protein
MGNENGMLRCEDKICKGSVMKILMGGNRGSGTVHIFVVAYIGPRDLVYHFGTAVSQ